MNNFELIKAISEAVAKPPSLIEKWLNQSFLQAEVELLTRGTLPLAGLGMLRKTFLPAEPKEVNGELVLVPPKTAIILQKDAPLKEDFLAAIAVGSLNISESDAKLLSRNFSKIAKSQIESGKQIRIGRLGAIMLSSESLQLTFVPTTWATAILNTASGDLVPVPLSVDSNPSEKHNKILTPKNEFSDLSTQSIALSETPQIDKVLLAPLGASVHLDGGIGKNPDSSSKEDFETTAEMEAPENILNTNNTDSLELRANTANPAFQPLSTDLIPPPVSSDLNVNEVNTVIVNEKEPVNHSISKSVEETPASHATPEIPSVSAQKEKKKDYTDDIYDPYYEPPVQRFTYQPPKDFTPDLSSDAIHHNEEGINTTLSELEETLDRERQKETRRNIIIIAIIGVVIIGGVWLYQNTIADNVNAILTQKIEEQEKAKEKISQQIEKKQDEVKVNVDSALIAYQKESKIRQEQERFLSILKRAGSTAKLPPATKKPINPSKGGYGIKIAEYETIEEALGVGSVYARAKISNYTFSVGPIGSERYVIVVGQFPSAASVQQLIRRFPKFFPEKAEPIAIKKPVKK